jgi:hypothetical protein
LNFASEGDPPFLLYYDKVEFFLTKNAALVQYPEDLYQLHEQASCNKKLKAKNKK